MEEDPDEKPDCESCPKVKPTRENRDTVRLYLLMTCKLAQKLTGFQKLIFEVYTGGTLKQKIALQKICYLHEWLEFHETP